MKLCLSLLLCIIFLSKTIAQVPDSLRRIFLYDKVSPFNFQKVHEFVYTNPSVSLYHLTDTSARGNNFHVRVSTVTYASADSFTAHAYITQPVLFEKSKNQGLIIFQHWGEGNKDQFLSEAIEYSKKGFICFLPESVFSTPGSKFTSFSRHGYPIYRLGTINVLRGLDLIEANYKIDKSNIFFVGHSYGAGIGGILTGIEPRIKAFVLMTGVYSSTNSLRNSKRPDILNWKKNFAGAFEDWLTRMRPLDADLYLQHKKAPALLQFATNDEFIDQEDFKEYEQKTPAPKKSIYYPAKHDLNEQAKKDREAFIWQHVSK